MKTRFPTSLMAATLLLAVAASLVVAWLVSDTADPGPELESAPIVNERAPGDAGTPRRSRSENRIAGEVRGRLIDAAGAGLAGADVIIVFAALPGATSASQEPVAERRTGSDGVFVLESAAPGHLLRVRTRLAGYTDVVREVVYSGGDVDLGDFTTAPGGAIEVTVRDESEAPVIDAEVLAGRVAERRGGPGFTVRGGIDRESARSARTDARGVARVQGLLPGAVEVIVLAPDFEPGARSGVNVPADGTPAEVRVRLRRGRDLEGRVELAGGGPLEGALIELVTEGYLPDDRMLLDWSRRTATTDAAGVYRFRGLPRRGYRMRVSTRGCLPLVGRAIGPEDRRMDVVLDPAARVYGYVADAESGSPIREFEIRATMYGNAALEEPAASRVLRGAAAAAFVRATEVDHLFALEGLETDRINLTIAAPGWIRSDVLVERLDPGEVRKLDIALQRDIALTGVVQAEDGAAPVEGATVTATRTDFDPPDRSAELALITGDLAAVDPSFGYTRPQAHREATATTDATGGFSVRGLAAGLYRVEASHPDHLPSPAQEVRLRAGEPSRPVTLTLESAGLIHGHCRWQGRAFPWAIVVLKNRTAGAGGDAFAALLFSAVVQKCTADAAGRFEMRAVPPGSYTLAIAGVEWDDGSGPTFDPTAGDGAKPVRVGRGETLEVDLEVR